MTKYRTLLPQLGAGIFLTDGGMETTLIFHDKIDLPHFASFDLLKNNTGRAQTLAYYERYIAIAKRSGLGFILETPTWRANREWGAKLGYSPDALAQVNRDAVALLATLRNAHESDRTPIVISGNIGPRGDGYAVERAMSPAEAQDYHAPQIATFAESEADLVSAFTMNYVEEAVGIAAAAKAAGMPCVISFTVEIDGNLPTGQSLKDAVTDVDRTTGNAPAYYMINCAHPAHFDATLGEGDWLLRLRGLRANASLRSHAELDAAPDLDSGDPLDLGMRYRKLRLRMPQMTVLGGCCGTDHRHVEQICFACVDVKGEA